MVGYIIDNISLLMKDDEQDKAWRMFNTSGNFTVKSAWEIMRHRREKNEIFDMIRVKGIPFKINLFF